jgi:predicted transport protein
MSVSSSIEAALATAEQLKAAGAANEANTKHHVIEPLIGALGWNLTNFSEVDREYKVFDGTFLDYALRVDGKPKLFVEAKALGKSLADKQFVAQAVNYANNEGVVWCVLTNGFVYQVYKSNEPVAMDKKLLFEVDLRDAQEQADVDQAVRSLRAISRDSVESGELDLWGERIFTDIRVRAALAQLGASLDTKFVNAIAGAIEGPPIDKARLKSSIARVLAGMTTTESVGGVVGSPSVAPAKSKPKAPATHALAGHTAKVPAVIVDLFEKVDAFAKALGPDVSQRPAKYYIGYFVGKASFVTLNLKKAKISVYVSVPPAEAEGWDDADMRDVTNIGKHGLGNTEFNLHAPEQLPRLEKLIQQSYLRNRK